MWSFKKKEKKGIKLAAGKSMEIGFAASWSRDKDEVLIMTDAGPVILDGKNELFIEIGAENIDPIKLQVVPDFKKRVINLVEVIDPNSKRKFPDREGPRLTFAGSTIIKERSLTIGDYLKDLDRDVKRLEKITNRSKIIRNIVIPLNVVLFFMNSYLFITNRDIFRYINLFVAIMCICVIYYLWISHKKVYNLYLEYQDLNKKSFEIVKEK
jgi:hypothetical protein